MQITNFAQANKVLKSYVPAKPPKVYTLDTMRALMQALGNPQDAYKVIHIAGTSGKTSTAYYIASLLQQIGTRVGLTISPHIDQVNERVQIGLVPLAEQEFCSELTEFINTINKLSIKPSYFELLVAFAYWEFARQKVDYAVVEVGLGGLLDGTNVVTRADKVCVITDIGYDHIRILGNKIHNIAEQKAGIIQPGNDLLCYEQSQEIDHVITKTCVVQNANLHHVQQGAVGKDHLLPLFQERNWSLANATAEFITKRDDLRSLTNKNLLASQQVQVPGRLEEVKIRGKTLIMDGAHNAQKMHALVTSLRDKFPSQTYAIVLSISMADDQKAGAVLDELLPLARKIIVTPFTAQQDQRKHSTSVQEIVSQCHARNFTNTYVAKSVQEAFEVLLQEDGPLMICGSFYLLNKIRPYVFSATVDI